MVKRVIIPPHMELHRALRDGGVVTRGGFLIVTAMYTAMVLL